MLIDRADNVVNVCEMKFSNGSYEISEDEDLKLQTRVEAFANAVGGDKTGKHRYGHGANKCIPVRHDEHVVLIPPFIRPFCVHS